MCLATSQEPMWYTPVSAIGYTLCKWLLETDGGGSKTEISHEVLEPQIGFVVPFVVILIVGKATSWDALVGLGII